MSEIKPNEEDVRKASEYLHSLGMFSQTRMVQLAIILAETRRQEQDKMLNAIGKCVQSVIVGWMLDS